MHTNLVFSFLSVLVDLKRKSLVSENSALKIPLAGQRQKTDVTQQLQTKIYFNN